MEQYDFIKLIKDKAIELQSIYGILPSITISQGILESGWGKSELFQNANNTFGIKWAENCGYDKYLVNTNEVENGKTITIPAYFRKYNSLEDSIQDHAIFLQKDRYKNIIGDMNYLSVANKLYQDGYSTSPEYPNKLIKLIEQYNLNQYDNVDKKGSNEKMVIGLRGGHSSNCEGAIGIVDEYQQMQQYFKAVKSVFEQYGHTVIDCNSNGGNASAELSEGANKSNSANCDIFISLHMNCFNGSAHGTEVLVSSENSSAYPYAQRLVSNFEELGFFNRGVKFERLYEMNHVNCGNIISEICFCDSQDDMNIYNQYSWEKLAHVLCNAIDSNIPKDIDSNVTTTTTAQTGYVITNYLPNGCQGNNEFVGVDSDYVLQYFKDVRCYFRGNEKGIWIETQTLPMDKCLELKSALGSWFYKIG